MEEMLRNVLYYNIQSRHSFPGLKTPVLDNWIFMMMFLTLNPLPPSLSLYHKRCLDL